MPFSKYSVSVFQPAVTLAEFSKIISLVLLSIIVSQKLMFFGQYY
jgi:hypothetical protein